MFDLVKYRFLFLLVSGLVIIPGFVSLIIYQLNVGIDFTNGSEVDMQCPKPSAMELVPFSLCCMTSWLLSAPSRSSVTSAFPDD